MLVKVGHADKLIFEIEIFIVTWQLIIMFCENNFYTYVSSIGNCSGIKTRFVADGNYNKKL